MSRSSGARVIIRRARVLQIKNLSAAIINYQVLVLCSVRSPFFRATARGKAMQLNSIVPYLALEYLFHWTKVVDKELCIPYLISIQMQPIYYTIKQDFINNVKMLSYYN